MKVIKNKKGKVIGKKGNAFAKELRKVEQRVKDVLREIDEKKIGILCNIVQQLDLPVTEETFARITCVGNLENINYTQYFLDHETENEKVLMEFEIVYPEGGLPTMQVTSPFNIQFNQEQSSGLDL